MTLDQIDSNGKVTVIVHYVFRTSPEQIACLPDVEELYATAHHPHYQRTSEKRAVTCLQCRKTDQFIEGD